MKRTRIKPVSKKQSARNRTRSRLRAEFLRELPMCCLCSYKATECHEIVGGSSRQSTMVDRRLWLGVCHDCHKIIQYMAKPVQLAIKRRVDPEYYDLAAFNRAYRNDRSRAVTGADVDAAEGDVP